MRRILPLLLVLFSLQAWSQSACPRKSSLFHFDPQMKPRLFTEKLGNHPQFPFLQRDSGVITRAAFLKAAKDPASRKTSKKEFGVFNELLKDIGFAGGYRDLKLGDIENLYINSGTIGNLGFFNNENGYIYVRLNPAGEGDDGIAAWRVTGPEGCYFYILHTCGNAFFANDPDGTGSGCCRDLTLKTQTDTLTAAARPRKRPLYLSIRLYQARISAGRHKYDTAYQFVRSIDTIAMVGDSASASGKAWGTGSITQLLVCRDTVLTVKVPLRMDTTAEPGRLNYTFADTSFGREYSGMQDCRRKWEIAADGGVSFNSIPRYDNTTDHTRTNGAQPVGELAVSRIFSRWFQAGIAASWMTLSYQDDLPYAGSTPNTYNTIYPAKPIVPIQLFGKATIGGPAGWQSTISLMAGYSIPVGHGQISDNGATLAATPSLKGGLTAGLRMAVAYFFNCSFGVCLSAGGQYFDNKGSLMTYHLIALPVTLGLRFRF
ncbi:MAG TPA: hypothetical protein VNV35_09835 [Puia sp.]|nr:hypothetical protein [Puia sp.]